MALSWVLRKDRVSSVLVEQQDISAEKCKCIESLDFSDDELKAIDDAINY